MLARLQEDDEASGPIEYREISLGGSGCARHGGSGDDRHDAEPPTNEDFDDLRALVMARLAKLPPGGVVPEASGVSEDERDRSWPSSSSRTRPSGCEGSRLRITRTTPSSIWLTRSSPSLLDYVLGTPLRFSPVMVEIFCLDWAPARSPSTATALTLLPDVLAAWIRFVGRRRGIPRRRSRKRSTPPTSTRPK